MKYRYLLTILWLIVPNAQAHEPDSFEMSFANWLAHHESIQVTEASVKVSCTLRQGVHGKYIDIPLGNTLDIHRTLYDESYNIAASGWLNTFAVKSGNVEIMLHHSKPVLPRNQYYDEKLYLFIEELKRTGKFEYIYELNTHRHGHVLLSTLQGNRVVPGGYHFRVSLENPGDVATCLE
ncbi:hypothetical protein [Opacimonas viscosa]|uniref:Uncharacterized protein n=1 Tax=Opacimonas viscosa TaxID=2961944 RepID=A0AA42BLC5_9ALTE|nr:hypothetical protein [Opacimonas viscosa]MCP3427447.1 hypothetical protein [Opacimonas viscosa]